MTDMKKSEKLYIYLSVLEPSIGRISVWTSLSCYILDAIL